VRSSTVLIGLFDFRSILSWSVCESLQGGSRCDS
jgi:hypothetical protein